MTRCAVIGGGAWGTALADILARNGHDTVLWALEGDVVAAVNSDHENKRFLAGFKLSETLRATSSFGHALDSASLVCIATPSQHTRSVLKPARAHLAPRAILCVASKGIERDTLALMSDVVAEEAPQHPVVALSGPSFAAEVAGKAEPRCWRTIAVGSRRSQTGWQVRSGYSAATSVWGRARAG